MTDKQLSPAAQAVLDGAFPTYDCEALYSLTEEQHAGMIAAAALRVAADQAMPEFFTLGPVSSGTKGHEDRQGLIRYRLFAKMIRNRLLAIANELEGK